MKFSIFESVKSARGAVCTYEKFLELTHDAGLLEILKQIASEHDDERRGEMKKRLPIVTWQAYFAGKRVAKEAAPSGLFMLDLDHVEEPYLLYKDRICGRKEELGIVLVHLTPSRKGLRIVAKCRQEFSTIAECQQWLARETGVAYDAVCKDWARSSFLVHESYIYYMDGGLFTEEWPEVPRYAVEGAANGVKSEEWKVKSEGDTIEQREETPDQREGLLTPSAPLHRGNVQTSLALSPTPEASGGPTEYKGLTYEAIVKEWLRQTGGEPEKGERNARLYRLATRLRYITDFNEAVMLRIMPRYGLSEAEVKGLIHSACTGTRASSMPKDLQETIAVLLKRNAIGDTGDEEDLSESATRLEMPTMPPVIRQFVDNAPEDFKTAVALCQLPILGALGSRLRAKYLDGQIHSPSFQVSLEAPQASGKSFMSRLVNYELRQMMEHDKEQREKEQEYDKKVREMKLLNVKVTVENKDEVLGQRPKSLIRYVPATMSITKLLMRMESARGLHLFAFAPEIDTVTKAFKRGFTSYSDLLRVGFDNELYGQDYASENSFSGIIPIYYNMLCSGTPKAMRRFYPDVEDGLVSRVLFVSLPDQFGKPMPMWQELDEHGRSIVDVGLVRLNEVSLIGDEVQDEHMMKLEWLNKEIQQWIVKQQSTAVSENDRTRDVFCRRSAVVGFRAGMLCYFLYGEKNTPTIRKNTVRFALWVAECMLNQHLLRFNLQKTFSNTNPFEETFAMLGDEFTRGELEKAMVATGVDTNIRTVIYKWKLGGLIEVTQEGRQETKGNKLSVKFKKIRK